MSSRVHSYLRTERRTWALTQKELSFLFGRKSSTQVSRLEQGERIPALDIVLACEILFTKTPRELFPKLYAELEEEVVRRAAELFEKLAPETDHTSMRKKEFLMALEKRAITRLNNQKEHES
jgi:transcriptional regulator with XRE-family HTH domain